MFEHFKGDILIAVTRRTPKSKLRYVNKDIYNLKSVINVIHKTGRIRRWKRVSARFIGTKTRIALKDNRFIITRVICNYSVGFTSNPWRRVETLSL